MTLRSAFLGLVLDTPLEPLARFLYKGLLPTQAARYDRELDKVIDRVVRLDTNSVDIGAHRGAVLSSLVRRAPKGRHFAVEPLAEHADYIARRFPSVTVVRAALGDYEGESEFLHVETRPTRSGLRSMPYPSKNERVSRIRVPVTCLDSTIPQDVSVGFVKIDVEGGEYAVLRGGVAMIRRDRPTIVFEHGPAGAEAYGFSSADLYRFLSRECGLAVSTMRRWLEGELPMNEVEFVATVSADRDYYFIAYP